MERLTHSTLRERHYLNGVLLGAARRHPGREPGSLGRSSGIVSGGMEVRGNCSGKRLACFPDHVGPLTALGATARSSEFRFDLTPGESGYTIVLQ